LCFDFFFFFFFFWFLSNAKLSIKQCLQILTHSVQWIVFGDAFYSNQAPIA
jgi:hypothetical protein